MNKARRVLELLLNVCEVGELEGSRVRLVKFTPEYVDIYHKWLQDEYIIGTTGTDRNLNLEDITKMRDEIEQADDMDHFLILDKKTSTPIGDIDFRDIEPGKRAEIAIMIAEPEFRGKGYAAETYELFMNYGFNRYKLKEIVAPILSSNTSSMEFHKRMGFKEVGRKNEDIIFVLSVENWSKVS